MTGNIYILTGEIHSGKTTALLRWLEGRTDVFGIASPDIDGTRYFMDVQTKERFKMIAEDDEPDTLQIGRYTFSSKAFKKATDILHLALRNSSGWIVLDEIGPLELKQEGFYNSVVEILSSQDTSRNKMFVVRKHLVDQVVDYFKISSYKIVTTPAGL
jgi:nucleoside-triphosphatase THEP1